MHPVPSGASSPNEVSEASQDRSDHDNEETADTDPLHRDIKTQFMELGGQTIASAHIGAVPIHCDNQFSDISVQDSPRSLDTSFLSRPIINDIIYELLLRDKYMYLIRNVVGGEERATTKDGILSYPEDFCRSYDNVGAETRDFPTWDDCSYSEDLLVRYYNGLPKARRDSLYSIKAEDVLKVLCKDALNTGLAGSACSPNAEYIRPFYNELFELYLKDKRAREHSAERKEDAEHASILSLLTHMDTGKVAIGSLTKRLLPLINKTFLMFNVQTEIDELLFAVEACVLKGQPSCNITDTFVSSLAYLDWLFGLPPVFPLSPIQTGQLSTIRASNTSALLSKAAFYLHQSFAFSVPPIDELNTYISPLLTWLLTSGLLDEYTGGDEWDIPLIAILSPLDWNDCASLEIDPAVMGDKCTDKNAKSATTPDACSMTIASCQYWDEVIERIFKLDSASNSEDGSADTTDVYMQTFKAFPSLKDTIERDIETQLNTVSRPICALCSDVFFLKTTVSNIYVVNVNPAALPASSPNKHSATYTYVPYEMISFLGHADQASDMGLYWDSTVYVVIRHVLDLILVSDLARGAIYCSVYDSFLSLLESTIQTAFNPLESLNSKSDEEAGVDKADVKYNCEDTELLTAHKLYNMQLTDIFNLDILPPFLYLISDGQAQSPRTPMNAANYFSNLIVRGVLTRLPAQSKLLIKLLLHITLGLLLYLKLLTEHILENCNSSPLNILMENISHKPQWILFTYVVHSLMKFMASGQIKVDIPRMFHVSAFDCTDCMDSSELGHAFAAQTELSEDEQRRIHDIVKLAFVHVLKIYYTQFARSDARRALEAGVSSKNINRVICLLHGSYPLILYIYTLNAVILASSATHDAALPPGTVSANFAVSSTFTPAKLHSAMSYLQTIVPDIALCKQVHGTSLRSPCVYAVSDSRTLIIPLPLAPGDDVRKWERDRRSKADSMQIKTVLGSEADDERRRTKLEIIREGQQCWTYIYLRHKDIYTLAPDYEQMLSVYMSYRITYSMIVCRTHGNAAIIEKLLERKIYQNESSVTSRLFSTVDILLLTSYFDISNKLAMEMEDCKYALQQLKASEHMDILRYGVFPITVGFTFADCIRSVITRIITLRFFTMFETDLLALDFSPLRNEVAVSRPQTSGGSDRYEEKEDEEECEKRIGGESILPEEDGRGSGDYDNKCKESTPLSGVESPAQDASSTKSDESSYSLYTSDTEENGDTMQQHTKKVGRRQSNIGMPSPMDSIFAGMYRAMRNKPRDVCISYLLGTCTVKLEAHRTQEYIEDTIGAHLMSIHWQQQIALRYLLFPGFYVYSALSALLADLCCIAEEGYAPASVNARDSRDGCAWLALNVSALQKSTRITAGEIVLALAGYSGAQICPFVPNETYARFCTHYPALHQLLATYILQDMLGYLGSATYTDCGFEFRSVDALTFLETLKHEPIGELRADELALLELIIRSTNLSPAYLSALVCTNDVVSVLRELFAVSKTKIPEILVLTANTRLMERFSGAKPEPSSPDVTTLWLRALPDLIETLRGIEAGGTSPEYMSQRMGLVDPSCQKTMKSVETPRETNKKAQQTYPCMTHRILQLLSIISNLPN